jgi:hypothetical protein
VGAGWVFGEEVRGRFGGAFARFGGWQEEEEPPARRPWPCEAQHPETGASLQLGKSRKGGRLKRKEKGKESRIVWYGWMAI